jgi:hypothetical protein
MSTDPSFTDSPRALRGAPGLHIEWVGDEAVVLEPKSGQLHYLNPSAALIFGLISEVGGERAVEELKRSFADVPNFDSELVHAIRDMVEKGLLTDAGTP